LVEYETVRLHLKAAGIVLRAALAHQKQPKIHRMLSKKALKETATASKDEDYVYQADEFKAELDALQSHVELHGGAGDDSDTRPTQKALRHGAVNDHTGETVVLIRRKHRPEVVEQLLKKQSRGTVYIAWDNSHTHENEAMVRRAAARPVLVYLPTLPLVELLELLWRPLDAR
jgi:hypothetical protein